MKIKSSMLKALVGLDASVGKELVEASGLKCRVLPTGTITIAIAVPNTVMLYETNGKVTYASAGDPLQVVSD